MPPTSGFHFRWHPGPLETRVRRGMANNLRDAIEQLRKYVIKDISHQGHPGYHSQPYQAPFRQSGDLRRSYKTMVDRRALMAQLYSDLDYAYWLEVGTSRMAARPHLRYNLWTRRTDLAKILTRPV